MEHFPYGKQIGEILDIKNMQKRHRAPKQIFGHLKVQKVQKVDFFEYVRNEAMLVIVFYFFPKHAICDFLWTCKFCMFFLKTVVFPKNAT